MTDDKPKHKPQQKHTLSEVLKSLQDLIRTEVIPRQTAPRPGTTEKPAAAAPASSEPESFDQALDNLDRMITERIIKPVERAHEAPPEPLLPDETLEIEWDESASDVASPDETIELEPRAEELEPPSVEGIETVELDAADVPPPAEPDEGVPQEQPSQETIDLADVTPPTETDGQHAFGFVESPLQTAAPAGITVRSENSTPTTAITADAEVVLLDVTASRAPEDTGDRSTAPSAETPEDHPEPKPPSEESRHPCDEAHDSAAVPALTIEYTGASRAAAAAATGKAPATMHPASGTNEAKAAEEQVVKPKPKATPKAPENRQPPPSAAASKERPAPGKPESYAAAASPSKSGATAGAEIPVLKEVADLRAPPAARLPDASHARDIAIRVIAKLNIERRKTGEPPLDIKTIERLQQYLTDALTKRALNKPK